MYVMGEQHGVGEKSGPDAEDVIQDIEVELQVVAGHGDSLQRLAIFGLHCVEGRRGHPNRTRLAHRAVHRQPMDRKPGVMHVLWNRQRL